mmetsp:Transcript_15524/g.44171  ORF Transcript_15524/g.44171 Transcript_15524/m.44171 type:complete len:315 (+) Transcript_15524:68-1012(+)
MQRRARRSCGGAVRGPLPAEYGPIRRGAWAIGQKAAGQHASAEVNVVVQRLADHADPALAVVGVLHNIQRGVGDGGQVSEDGFHGEDFGLREHHEIRPFGGHPLELEEHAMDVEVLGRTLNAHAPVAKVLDVDAASAVPVEQAEEGSGVVGRDVQGLHIHAQVRVIHDLLHLRHADCARVVLVDLVEDLSHVRDEVLVVALPILDQQLPVMLRCPHGAFDKDARHDIEDPEGRQSDEDDEQDDQEVPDAHERTDEVAPRLPLRHAHVKSVRAAQQRTVVVQQLRTDLAVGPDVLRHASREATRKGVDGEEEQDE